MSSPAEFLRDLLYQGRAVLRGPPEAPAGRDEGEKTVTLLRRAFEIHRLHVAGPVIEFDLKTALAAAQLMHWASWLLVSRAESDAEMEEVLRLPGPPRSPRQHLSADLLLRLLPTVHRRARALNPADRLATLLTEVLRGWPLSGVLSDVEEGPTTPLDFGEHPGLLLLYSERLARHEKPAWVPTGPAAEYVELVWAEGRKDASALLRAAQGREAHD
jgi:hypothetical protein